MRSSLSLALCSLLLVLPACKRTYKLETSAPAAAGLAKIVVDRDKTGNGSIDLSFDHLAAPGDIDPEFQAYVVWAQVEGSDAYKLGILEYKEKKRSGSLSATYSANEFTVIMTLEKDPATDVPLGTQVLQQPVVAPKK